MQGGGGGGSTASSINPGFITSQQFKNNLETGIAQQAMSQTNQVTPYGSLTYNQTGGYSGPNGVWIPQYTATTTMSPEQQALYNQSNALKGSMFNLAQGYIPALQQGLSTELPKFGALPDTKAFTDQAYNALTARGNTELDRERDAAQVLAANQGVATGSEAYRRLQQPIEQGRVDLSNQSTINAQQLADQYFNRELQGRNWQMQDALQRRSLPFQEFAGLFGMANGGQPTQPNFVNTPQAQIQTPDMTSPFMAQAQLEAQDRQRGQSANNALMGSLFGLGGSVLGGALAGPLGGSLGGMFGGRAMGGGGSPATQYGMAVR